MNIVNPPLVWIEWGRKVPKYLVRNIQLHSRAFPDVSQYLVSEFEGLTVSTKNIQFENTLIQNIPKSDYLDRFDYITSKRTSVYSQTNFWVGTTRRFFLLYDFMQSKNLNNAVHMESDNVLLSWNEVLNKFNSSKLPLAYPMQSNVLGCGSIFFVRDVSGLERFLDYVLEDWENPLTNDMMLLGAFSQIKSVVEILPSWPTENIAFDPGSYGKFFLGSDARNFRFPTMRRGIVTEDDLSLLKFMPGIRISTEGRGKNFAIIINNQTRLMNLHVHSKSIPSRTFLLERSVKRGISKKRGFFWRQGKIDFMIIAERILSRLSKLIGTGKDVRFR
jgi:hypothetical protein